MVACGAFLRGPRTLLKNIWAMFGLRYSENMLCIPKELKADVFGFPKITDENDHPRNWPKPPNSLPTREDFLTPEQRAL